MYILCNLLEEKWLICYCVVYLSEINGEVEYFQILDQSSIFTSEISNTKMSANPNRSASSGQPSTPIAANQKGSKKTTLQSKQSNIPVGPITESVINTSNTDIGKRNHSFHIKSNRFVLANLGNATVQKNTTGPPASIQPKPQLTRAERRAIQVISMRITYFQLRSIF